MHIKWLSSILAITLIAVWLLACTGTIGGTESELNGTVAYLKSNIHGTERISGDSRSIRASYANYVGNYAHHSIIPVNTQVTIDKVARNGIYMTTQNDGTEIVIEYHAGNMGEISAEDYVGLITSPTQVSLDRFDSIDRKGIRAGEVYQGMSKDGVRIAWGYPARHRTPSLEENDWVYWLNRFATTTVEFNPGGKVTAVR